MEDLLSWNGDRRKRPKPPRFDALNIPREETELAIELERLSGNLSRFVKVWVKKAHEDVWAEITKPGNLKRNPPNMQRSDMGDTQDALNQEHIKDEWDQTERASLGDTIPVEMINTGVISSLPLPPPSNTENT